MDEQAVNLAKAIRQTESGGNYTAKGDSGESGAYQWTPDTWKAHAKQALGDENAPMTPQNQNAVAYTVIKQWKDSGLNAAQIAAKWNSGSENNWENKIGTNSMGVKYNVPQYVKSVTDAYQKIKSGQDVGIDPNNPSAVTNNVPKPDANGYVTSPAFTNAPNTSDISSDTPGGGLVDHLRSRLSDASKALSSAAAGQINPLSGIVQTIGAGAGAVGDTVNAGLELIPGVKGLEGLIGKGVGKLTQTDAGQSVVGGINDFAKAHPELAGDIGAVGNIAGVVGLASGAGAVKDALGSALGKAVGKDALSTTIDAISPEIKAGTKAGAKNVLKKGTVKSLLTGTIERVEDPEMREAAQVVESNIPKFNKLKTASAQLAAIQDEAIPKEANILRSALTQEGVQPLVTPEAYQKFLTGIDTAISNSPSLVGDSGEYAKRLLKEFQSNLPQTGEITMENVLDARQALDKSVLKYKPTAFDKQGAFNDGLNAVRNAANQMLDESAPNAGVRTSLRRQSLLYKAAKNLAPKADKEIGSTALSRLAGRYPRITGFVKGTTKKGLEGLVGYEVVKKASQ